MQALKLDLVDKIQKRQGASWPIYIAIDSPGGDVEAGLDFIEFAKTLDNVRTVTIFGASMAANIVQGLPGSRLITGQGVLMFHRARGQIAGQIEDGELESRLALIKAKLRAMEQIVADRLGISLSEFKARILNEYWLSADRALADKVADKKVDILCSQELIDLRVEAEKCSMFGCNTLEFSGCPTFRLPIVSKKNAEAIIGI